MTLVKAIEEQFARQAGMYTGWGSKGKAQSSEKTCCYCFCLTYCIGGGYYPPPFAWQEFMI